MLVAWDRKREDGRSRMGTEFEFSKILKEGRVRKLSLLVKHFPCECAELSLVPSVWVKKAKEAHTWNSLGRQRQVYPLGFLSKF